MPIKSITSGLYERISTKSSLKSTLSFWFLVVSIIPFITAIVLLMHYFEKNLSEDFQKRLKKNHDGVEIEIEDILKGLKEMSRKNAIDEWIVSATLQQEIVSLDAITFYLLKLESLDEISVYDYDGKKLASAKNPNLIKIQKASLAIDGAHNKDDSALAFLLPDKAHAAEGIGFDIDEIDEAAQEPKGAMGVAEMLASSLKKEMVDAIINKGELTVRSIDNDFGLRLDVYSVIKEVGIDRVSGIIRNTIIIGQRFCDKYKEKTGIDLMIISRDIMVSSLLRDDLKGVDFSDIYSRLDKDAHYYGNEMIEGIEHEYFLSPLSDDGSLLDAGIVLFLSKKDVLASIKKLKLTVTGIGIVIFVLVFILSITLTKFITDPVNTVLYKLKEISHGRGDLTERIVVNSKNEIGELAKWFNKFMENMQEMVTSINEVSSSLSVSSSDISDKMKMITDSTSSQISSVSTMLTSIEEMNSSTKGIAEAVNELSNSAEKSSSAVLETDATVKELSINSETLSTAVESSAMSISEMVASIKQVDNHANVLSMITNDTQDSMKLIDDAITKIEDNATQTVKLSEQSIKDASAGMQSVNETIKGINLIKDSVSRASTVIEALVKRIATVDDILDVIDNVAEQTNLLALNAAIIAAQAGEHGKGFAIVADEIKDLADRTAASTKEIASIIVSVQKESNNAVEVMKASSDSVIKSVALSKEAGNMLKKILANAEKSTGRVKDIASSTEMQSGKTSEVMKSMVEVAQMVNQISSATKEQSVGSNMILKATESIKDIAYQLKTAVKEQTVASKDISSEIMNVSQMVKQINKAITIQQEQSEASLGSTRKINETAKNNQLIINELDSIVESLEGKSTVLNNEIGKFKV